MDTNANIQCAAVIKNVKEVTLFGTLEDSQDSGVAAVQRRRLEREIESPSHWMGILITGS
ncbi:MAG: hypothetical protein AAB658_17695 [Chloroflexota bacterium]